MPLCTTVHINNEPLYHIHISNMSGTGVAENDVNEYSIVVSTRDTDVTGKPWSPSWGDYLNGVYFTHMYGDGALECLALGLQAWKTNGKPLY